MSTKRLVNVSRNWLFTVVIVMAAATAAQAGSTSWQHDPATPGDWFTTVNWTAGVPGMSDGAHIENGGTAIISSGPLYVDEVYIGYANVGHIQQLSGNAYAGTLTLGRLEGAEGTYRMLGGSLRAEMVFLGDCGSGLLEHTGGRIYARWDMDLYVRAGGEYHISEVVELDAGWITIAGDHLRKGQFVQDGGEVAVSERLAVGWGSSAGNLGMYALNQGLLSTAFTLVSAYDGLMIQTGGCHLPEVLTIQENAKYQFTGGTLQVEKKFNLEGEMDFANSSATISTGQFAWVDFSLQGAQISKADNATFCGGQNSMVLYTSQCNPQTAFGTYQNEGITHEIGTDLIIPADKHIRCSVDVDHIITDHVFCHGTIDITDPNVALTLEGGIEVFEGANVDFRTGRGEIIIDDVVSGMSGGRIDSAGIRVGVNGSGVFTHTGGTIERGGITVGCQTGTAGQYILDGVDAVISGGGIDVGQGCSGLFTHRSGCVSVGSISVGKIHSAGRYELIDGEIDLSSRLAVGSDLNSEGVFIQTGGVLFADNIDLGRFSGSGTYQLKGGACVGKWVNVGEYAGWGKLEVYDGSANAEYLTVGYSSSARGELAILDASPLLTVRERFYVGPKGYISAVPGATIHMTGSAFENQSTDSSALSGLKNLRLIFEGGTADLDPFEVAGQDKGGNWEAFHNNFTLGTLQLGGADVGQVQLVDNFDNQPYWEGVEALYVRNLRISAGSQLDLNGKNLYCLGYANLGGVVTGGVVTEVPPIQSINATYLDSGFVPTGGAYSIGELTVSDAADVVVESSAGQTTYEDCLVSMATSLFADNSTGGLAGGVFRDGQLVIKDSADADMLTGEMIELELHEVIDGAGLLAGQGVFEVTGGSLEEAFLLPLGKIVQITFEIDPADIDDFSVAFIGVSNITLTPIPEPAALSLLAVGALALVRRRRQRRFWRVA